MIFHEISTAYVSKQVALTGLDWPLDVAIGRNYSEYLLTVDSEDYIE